MPHEWLHGVPVKAQDTACHSCTKSLINKASTLPEVRSIVTGKGSRDYREKGWAKLKVLSKEETCYRGSWFKAQKSTELTMRSAFLGGIFRTLGGTQRDKKLPTFFSLTFIHLRGESGFHTNQIIVNLKQG